MGEITIHAPVLSHWRHEHTWPLIEKNEAINQEK